MTSNPASQAREKTLMRILLIEQDPHLRQKLAGDLEARGHEVIRASDGATGLRLLDEEAPDAVVMNIVAPGGDAIELLTALRARRRSGDWRGTPLVTYLDRDDPLLRASARIALLMGARGAFMKPLDPDRILAALRGCPPDGASGAGTIDDPPPETGP